MDNLAIAVVTVVAVVGAVVAVDKIKKEFANEMLTGFSAKLIKQGVDVEKIAKAGGVSTKTIMEIKNNIEKQKELEEGQ